MKSVNFQISVWTIGAVVLLTAAILFFYYYPQIDLFFARELYIGNGKFLLSDSKLAAFFHGPLDMMLKFGFLTALVGYLVICALHIKISSELHKKLIFIFSTAFLSELIIINWVLKNHWGRPRPVQVDQFGGSIATHFEPAGRISHECIQNCSFSSGHAGIAACVGLLAIFLPPRWRPSFLILTIIFVAVVGFMRMARGAHFLSDVTISPLIVLATAMVVKDLLRLKA